VAAKRDTSPPDGMSYNKYSQSGPGDGDTSIAKENRSAESGNLSQHFADDISRILSEDFSTVSPLVFYDIRDAAKILEKAPVTVRKEAREKHIGTIKGQGYLFNDQDILHLIASFEEKEARRRHPLDKPKEEVSISRALFEQVVYLKKMMVEFKKDRERFLMVFQTFFNQYNYWREEVDKRISKLEGR